MSQNAVVQAPDRPFERALRAYARLWRELPRHLTHLVLTAVPASVVLLRA